MPTLQPGDLAIAKTLDAWRQTVADELDDLKAWLAAPGERCMFMPAAEPPERLYTRTATLCSWAAVNLPNVDAAPVKAVYQLILDWHQPDNNSLPSPREIDRLADEAMLAADAIERGLLGRASEPPVDPPRAEPADVDQSALADGIAWAVENMGDEVSQAILAIANEDKPADDRLRKIVLIDERYCGKESPELGKLLSVSAAAIRGTLTWKAIRKYQDPANDNSLRALLDAE